MCLKAFIAQHLPQRFTQPLFQAVSGQAETQQAQLQVLVGTCCSSDFWVVQTGTGIPVLANASLALALAAHIPRVQLSV